MVPRRIQTLTTSTPSVANPSATFGIASEASDPSTISAGSSFVIKHDAVSKMTTLEWVLKAIETVGVPRKGASYIAILRWIVNNKDNVMINRLKTNLKKAIAKALDNGLLKRPAISKNVTGLRGYFMKNKDAITVQKIPKTKTARKLIEITNVTKVVKTKNAAALKSKASVQQKAHAEQSTKPKQLTKSAKSNHDADVAGSSRKHKAQPKSKAEKPKTDAVEGNPKTQPKANSAKPIPYAGAVTSSEPKIQHKAAEPNPDSEAGPSYKLRTQPKSKTAKSNLDAEAGPNIKPKSQPKSKAIEPNLDAVAGPNIKPKSQPKPKAVEPNLDAEAGPNIKPKSQPKSKAVEPNLDAEAGPNIKPKSQPKSKAVEPNLDAMARPSNKPKTQPKSKTATSNLDAETGPSIKPKTQPKSRAADPEAAPSKPKTRAISDAERNPEAGPSSKLKTPPKTKAAVKPRPGKLPVPVLKDILPSKVQKAPSKAKVSQIHPKRLHMPPGELPLNISREECYDTELNAKQHHSNIRVDNRNSYTSNPDSEVIYNKKVAKATKVAKNFEVKKLNKKETSETGPSITHAKNRKGKNTTADV